MNEKKKQIIELSRNVLAGKDPGRATDPCQVDMLAGDGSQRYFFRLRYSDDSSIIAIFPAAGQRQGMAEALSSWHIGNHLYARGIPVPQLLAFDPTSGLILTEDLGDLRLHGYAQEAKTANEPELYAIYREAVRQLARMQIEGARGFDETWCWQTPQYDRRLMLERESGYFFESLCRNVLNIDMTYSALQPEFEDIADHAAEAPSNYFLHRDFQSRNIMIQNGRVRIIDYQGGRRGPLAYDLSSLLLDPYVGLSVEMQERLLEEYLFALQSYCSYDSRRFRYEYAFLSLQRNLQILGAFAFLSQQKGKTFFRPYIRPALLSLREILHRLKGEGYPVLARLVQTCLDRVSGQSA